MTLLLAVHYCERIIFVIEHKGKIIPCYRSSGLSGTGHKNQILPFSSIEVSRDFLGITPGYIYKEMFYDNKWINHRKNLKYFPNVYKFMQEIQEFVKDINLICDHIEVITWDDMLQVANQTSDKLKPYFEQYEFLDLKYV